MAISYFKIDSASDSYSRLLLFILITTVISVFVQALLIVFYFGSLPPQIPLYFGRPWGEAILATPKELWILPASLCFVFILNWILARTLKTMSPFLVNILMIFTLIFSVCSLLSTLKIITLVA